MINREKGLTREEIVELEKNDTLMSNVLKIGVPLLGGILLTFLGYKLINSNKNKILLQK